MIILLMFRHLHKDPQGFGHLPSFQSTIFLQAMDKNLKGSSGGSHVRGYNLMFRAEFILSLC